MIPAEERHSLMVKIDHQINDRLSVDGDVVYSDRTAVQNISTGTITATVFGPGSGMGDQINPFFVAPTGTGATSGTVRFSGDELFPNSAQVASGHEIFYAHGNASFDITDNWQLNGFFVSGVAKSSETRTGELCSACVVLALNGTTNGNGTL
jgi:iron complex outermembrane receptor protein